MKRLLLLSFLCAAQLASNLFGQCPIGMSRVVIHLTTDNYPQETSWELTNNTTGQVYASVARQTRLTQNLTLYTDTLCVPTSACMKFQIDDSARDGICCGYGAGHYELYVDGVQVLAAPGNFGAQQITTFNCPPGTSCASPLTATVGNMTAPGPDSWYRFSPVDTGTYVISTCNLASCDTRIYIYDRCAGLVFDETNIGTIYYNDDEPSCAPQSSVRVNLSGGQTYYIRIGDTGTACAGSSIGWNITYAGPVTGCMDRNSCSFNPLATVSDPSQCIPWGDPRCPHSPDLEFVQSAVSNTFNLVNYTSTDPCLVNEGCVTGLGQRNIIRFDTHIKNIGDADYYIGAPSAQPGQFVYDACHNHNHYVGYAEYLLYDSLGNSLPAGFKNGFCVLDLECSGGGIGKYGCGNMGITAGCGDIYSSGLNCQWIDITNIPDGRYIFVGKVNWDRSADALGRVERTYDNNWVQECFRITRTNGVPAMSRITSCAPFVDCAGTPYGSAVPDCNGVCAGTTIRGDLNSNGSTDLLDAQTYFSSVPGASLAPTTCNDLDADGQITVYDASLLNSCNRYGAAHAHVGAGPHNHCRFPAGMHNNADTVSFKILNVNLAQQYVDIAMLNPTDRVSAYQFHIDGITPMTVTSLYSPVRFPVTAITSPSSAIVAAMSYQDSAIDRSYRWQPLCRVFYNNLTSNRICLDTIHKVVSKDGYTTERKIEGGCFLISGNQEVSEVFQVNVRPNPATQSTVFELGVDNIGATIELMDMTGKVVFSQAGITTSQYLLERGTLTAGLYVYRVTSDKGRSSGKLFFVD